MHAQRRCLLVFLIAVLGFVAAPAGLAATPQKMLFNDAASADVKGQVLSLSMDGGGRWGAVAVSDAPPLSSGLTLEDKELFAYNLATQTQAWQARDRDTVHEGARLVAVANGTSASQGGDWLVMVNNSVPDVLTAYRSNGQSSRGQDEAVWQFAPFAGTIYGLDINADSRVVAFASGGAGMNKTFAVLQNRFESQGPLTLFRSQLPETATNVTRYSSIAVATNSTVPDIVTANRGILVVVGAETVSAEGFIQGQVEVWDINFGGSDIEHPIGVRLFHRETSAPVDEVAISADGEYAVAGTQDGQVFLITIKEGLARRGVPGSNELVTTSTQQTVGSEVTSLAISKAGGEFVAVGTSDGQIALFQNRLDATRSEGAHLRDVARIRADTPQCGGTLKGPVASVDLSDGGEQLIAGVKNGLISIEAGAFARYFAAQPVEPAWCIPLPESDGGVRAEVSSDGRTIFAGTGNKVYGYKNFDKVTLAAADGQLRRASSPGTRVQFPLVVTNEGSTFDVVNVTTQGPLEPGWELEVSNHSLLLMPGKAQQILLNVTSPPNLAPGNFTLTVETHPQRAGDAGKATLGLNLDLGKLRRVEVRPPDVTQVASAGVENRFAITIHNGGNDADRFRLTAAIPE
ncbi:MAG TPA: hypothetical protein VGR28_03315, partial [Candidatus Thermoplasmatota archaeon]|nr:hypothetical protein [Candidatus Thermoplasmatota archaeon]